MDNDKYLSEKNKTKGGNMIPKKKKGKDVSTEIVVNFKFEDFEPANEKYQPIYKKQHGKIYYDNVDILDQNRFKFILERQGENENKTQICNNPKVGNKISLNTLNTVNNANSLNNLANINTSNSQSRYSKYSYQMNSNIKWEDIAAVIYYSVDIYTCPICLEKKLVCPVITRCGHIFCWPCLHNYYNYWTHNNNLNKKVPKCPLCQEKINISQAKFCEILHCVNYVSYLDSGVEEEGGVNNNNSHGSFNGINASPLKMNINPCHTHYISFNLIMKNKRAPILYNTYYDPDLEYYKKHLNQEDAFNFIPSESQEEFSFSRIFITNPQLTLKRYSAIKAELEAALKEELGLYADERRLTSLNECLDIISKKIGNIKEKNKDIESEEEVGELEENHEDNNTGNLHHTQLNLQGIEGSNSETINENYSTIDDEMSKSEKVDLNLKNFLYFYQEQYGDIYYLHPIDYSILLYEYSTEENLPIEITEKILEIDMYQTTPYLKNKYPFLNHLRIGSLFFFVEIDMKKLVSNHTLKQFHHVLKERAKVRNNIKREEENYNNYVQNIKSREDRKLSSEIIATASQKFKVSELFKEEVGLSEDAGERKESIHSDNGSENINISQKKENKLKLILESKDATDKEKENKAKNIANAEKFLYNQEDFPEIDQLTRKDGFTYEDDLHSRTRIPNQIENFDDGNVRVKAKSSNVKNAANKKKKKFAEVNIDIFKEIENKQKDIEEERVNRKTGTNLDKKNKKETNLKTNKK